MPGLLRSAAKALIALGCLTLLPAINAAASSGVVDAIQKKYVVTEVSADHNQVTKDGTTMELKCAGIYSLPVGLTMMSAPPDNTVSDGKLKSQNMIVKMTLEKFGAHVMQTGDKVYITKIDSKGDSKGDAIRFTIQSVDSLDVSGQSSQQKFTATVSFHFKKGYLDEAPLDEVEQAIETIMAPDTGSDQAQAGNSSQGAGQAQAQQQGPPQPRPTAPSSQQQAVAPPPQVAPAPAGPPPTITIGETSTQVLQAMGMPQQMIDLGKKKTYVYKNMKIIFVDDKVSDVQ